MFYCGSCNTADYYLFLLPLALSGFFLSPDQHFAKISPNLESMKYVTEVSLEHIMNFNVPLGLAVITAM